MEHHAPLNPLRDYSYKECARHLGSFKGAMNMVTEFSNKLLGSQVARQLPPLSATVSELNSAQKVFLCSLAGGGVALYFIAHLCRRERVEGDPGRSIRAARRARRASMSSKVPPAGAAETGSLRRGCSPYSFNWAELQRQSMATSDMDSLGSTVGTAATLVDGTELTPQQLGLMGMEALETVVAYWEDALVAYLPKKNGSQGMPKQLTTKEESHFAHLLDNLLEEAYHVQEKAETLFIHQNAAVHRRVQEMREFDDVRDAKDSGRSRNHLLSVSSVDNESFVSAQDTIADLADFEDLSILQGSADPVQSLYVQALDHLERFGVPYRTLRTQFVGCDSDSEYLAKLHCLRQAFGRLMADKEIKKWWIINGRHMLSVLLARSGRDCKDFVSTYDNLMAYLAQPDSLQLMEVELAAKNVPSINFYDVVMDYLLIDSFEDLESPPSSVLAVMHNRWLSNGFKESALSTAIWGVLKAKRRAMVVADGFKARFYDLSEILTPTLAWGFFGPDQELHNLMSYFKGQVLGFIHDIFDFGRTRYSSVEILGEDIMRQATQRLEETIAHLESR